VPVVQTETYAGTTITLIGLELRAGRFLASFRIQPGAEIADPRLVFRCRDDRGRRYHAAFDRASADPRRRGPWWLTYRLTPVPDGRVERLWLTVEKVRCRRSGSFRAGSWSFTAAL
jgi:hypothetical protein